MEEVRLEWSLEAWLGINLGREGGEGFKAEEIGDTHDTFLALC